MTHSTLFIKKLSSILEQRLDLPMWGKTPEFPWDSFSFALKEALNLKTFSLEMLSADWKEADVLTDGFGDDVFILSFVMSPLALPFFWMISKDDLYNFSTLLISKEEKRSFSDAFFQEAFIKFIFLHILNAFDPISPYLGLKAKMHISSLPKEAAYCIDISIDFQDKQCLGRLICPLSFHQVFTSHFSSKPIPLHRLDSSLELLLSIELGKVALTSHAITKVAIGDFVLLDDCSYHPNNHQGTFSLTLEGTPLFIVKRKNHEIKILDYALYSFEKPEMEEDFMMDNKEDLNLNDDEEEFEDEDLENEEEMFEDLEEDEEEESPDSKQTSTVEEILSATDIPLSICIEVAKIKMPLKQILSLQPGNTLQLPFSLEQGVYLTLNSKVIAKGELLQIGDLLGVKISEISH